MARQPRIEFEGAAYHVMSRGNHGEDVFLHQDDRSLFLDTLEEACGKTNWEIHAFVMMSNHYHILLVTPEANLVEGMKWFQGTFTQRHNARNHRRGHLFQGRYKAQIVSGEEDGYFRKAANYIHLNPARAGLLKRQRGNRRYRESLKSYPWSSYPLYLSLPRKRPEWLRVDDVLADHGWSDSAAGRRAYGEFLEEIATEEERNRARGESRAEWKPLRRGWCVGGDEFRDRMLDLAERVMKGNKKDSHRGPLVRESGERSAEMIARQCLERLGIKEQELPGMKKSAPEKQAVAWAIKRLTTVNNAWISKRLSMGYPTNVTNAVAACRRSVTKERNRLLKKVKQVLREKHGM